MWHALVPGTETTELAEKKLRTDRRLLSDLTAQIKAFESTQIIDGCIVSSSNKRLHYPQTEVKNLFVRKCYEDVFTLLIAGIGKGAKSFAISGTPGIGKSFFLVYILHRLLKDRSANSEFEATATPIASTFVSSSSSVAPTVDVIPDKIINQTGSFYQCYDLKEKSVSQVTHIEIA
eukprot:jgi/Hompol1/1599/HPOL_005655-RA